MPDGSSKLISGTGPDVVVGSDGGGQGQIVITVKQFGIDYANETAYSSYMPLSGNILYAPTLKATYNGSTEISTIYGFGAPQVGVWDFSIPNNSQFHGSTPMNSTFFSYYVRNINGLNRYTVENAYDPATLHSEALIYSYAAGVWETLYEAANAHCQGSSPIPCGEGWNLFEMHYTPGNICGTVPTISASQIQIYTSSWALANSSNSYADTLGTCFTGVPNPYVWDLNDAKTTTGPSQVERHEGEAPSSAPWLLSGNVASGLLE